MADITFTPTTASNAASFTVIPGTLQFGDGHDDRGGGNVQQARAGLAKNGQCEVVVTDANEASLLALPSGVGEGDYDITGDLIPANEQAYDALVDVEFGGDGVQTATIMWKGTTTAA